MNAYNIADKAWTMIGGRKFLAWLVTCGMHVTGIVDTDSWMAVTMVYIGGQSAIDVLASFKGLKESPGPMIPAAKKAAATTKKAAKEPAKEEQD